MEELFHSNPEKIKDCLEKVAAQYGENVQDVEVILSEYYSENNYFGEFPAVWTESSQNTGRNTYLKFWLTDSTKVRPLPKKKSPHSLRVCTFNVHFWFSAQNNFNMANIISDIDTISPDIVCLQEAVFPKNMAKKIIHSPDGWQENIVSIFELLGYSYYTGCETDNKNHSLGDSFFGNVIFSKYPISNGKSIKLGEYYQSRCAITVDVNFMGKNITVANLHLDVFDKTVKTREKMTLKILRKLSTIRNPLVLVGDFNSLWIRDYTNKEWKWLSRNNQNNPIESKIPGLLIKAGFKEAFGTGQMKSSAWTARRIDYIWYKNGIIPEKSNILYTDSSDHYPLYSDFVFYTEPLLNYRDHLLSLVDTQTSVRGKFKRLMWTHNTPLPVMKGIANGRFHPFIRGLDVTGQPVGRGAQFRYGIDSQYGDFIFIMKDGLWWEKMRGVDPITTRITKNPVLFHIFNENTPHIEYTKHTKQLAENEMEKDAKLFDFRSKYERGTGLECNNDLWTISWCNMQIHLGENVGFENVDTVLYPRWIMYLSGGPMGIIDPMLKKMVFNDLPFFPSGKTNFLNGKFISYGPKNVKDAYSYIDISISRDYPPTVVNQKYSSTRRNTMYLGSSSKLSISHNAFIDAEKIYMEHLVLNNMYYIDESEINIYDQVVYLLYITPKNVGDPSSRSVGLYGGFHITLYPEQPLSEDFDLDVLELPNSQNLWKPFLSPTESNKGIISLKVSEDDVISRIFEEAEQYGWKSENRWYPLHLTLGWSNEKLNHDSETENILNCQEWNLTLVKRIPKIVNPKTKIDCNYSWISDRPIYSF